MAYATAAQLYTRYGQTNCESWADMEGLGAVANAVAIAARIADALDTATARIDDRLRLGSLSFNVPLTGTVPTAIMHICRRLAGYELSTARGVKDYDGEGNPITRLYVDRQHAMDDLERIATGQLLPSFDV